MSRLNPPARPDAAASPAALTALPATLDHLRLITVAAPVVALDVAYALWPRDEALMWDPPAGPGAAATGTAVCLHATGARRMTDIMQASARVWRALEAAETLDGPRPRLWGGFAFAPGAAAGAPWEEFGDAAFVLPRITYWRDGDRAWLQGAAMGREDALRSELESARAALTRAAAQGEPPATAAVPEYSIAPVDRESWRRQVESILEAIAAGRAQKVVAARCARVTFARAPSVVRALANLRDETGGVWRFAFTRGGTTFLGATPEMLVARHGMTVESEALAGTLDKSAGPGGDLIARGKDRSEHEFVRQGIVNELAPLCAKLAVPAVPAVRELRQMFHLSSPIRGQLSAPLHVLELGERLHPTPATGGTPRAVAVESILATETTPRGWYGAPVGWFDATGDGELVVALRSGLVAGHEAYIYAGAGIVAGSRADDELDETRLKQRVLLRALGIDAS